MFVHRILRTFADGYMLVINRRGYVTAWPTRWVIFVELAVQYNGCRLVEENALPGNLHVTNGMQPFLRI